ncbi:MAG: glutathione S-transferase N-terminal domain-containing protein, partial [Gammaproteobacteria bacterium]|nr:glutathione S-transferase N-terminal domain-containing protein [Gammaproteobacteria bacterium]
MTPRLFHFWSDSNSSRLRMALSYKQIAYQDIPLSQQDDQTFFDLGLSRQVPVFIDSEEQIHRDSEELLWNIDLMFPDSPPLVNAIIDKAAWQALLSWRQSVDAVLKRLLAPALLSFKDISENEDTLADYKQSVIQQFGMSAEALASDRFASYEQFARLTNIVDLSRHLAKSRFYMGQLSIADIVLTADL